MGANGSYLVSNFGSTSGELVQSRSELMPEPMEPNWEPFPPKGRFGEYIADVHGVGGEVNGPKPLLSKVEAGGTIEFYDKR